MTSLETFFQTHDVQVVHIKQTKTGWVVGFLVNYKEMDQDDTEYRPKYFDTLVKFSDVSQDILGQLAFNKVKDQVLTTFDNLSGMD